MRSASIKQLNLIDKMSKYEYNSRWLGITSRYLTMSQASNIIRLLLYGEALIRGKYSHKDDFEELEQEEINLYNATMRGEEYRLTIFDY